MADIELAIKISEKAYESCKKEFKNLGENELIGEYEYAIANGTPLPKGHGRLIDEKDLSLMTVHMIDGTFVCDAPTIIEAESEVDNGNDSKRADNKVT